MHPLRRDAPDQKGCNAYGSGAPPPTTSTTADISSRHTQAAASDAATQPRNTRPALNKTHYTRSVAIHPLSRAAPVTSQCTRYVAMHPLRRAAPVTSRCTRSEGVQCLLIGCTASHNKPNRGQLLPTDPNRPHRTQPHGLDMLTPTPNKRRCTRYGLFIIEGVVGV